VNVFDAWCFAIDAGHDVTPAFQFAREIGPGCVFAAVVFGVWKALDEIRDLIRRRRDIRRLESFANHPANRTANRSPREEKP
jgi:hypothetical protein